MEKYNWRNDTALMIALADKGTAPVAVSAPKFYSQYKFIIYKHKGRTEVKRFVPEWAINIVSHMLDQDPNVKGYWHELTYKGNIK